VRVSAPCPRPADSWGEGNVRAREQAHRRDRCSRGVETCPSGQIGAEISPAQTGYFFDGLQRNTGVQIDASGNVWLTNNWKTVPEARNQYGDGLVVFLGAAAPIAMPLVGTPRAAAP
jgi:hypothetical protein